MEYNKETNLFYKIDYSNEVLFYEDEVPSLINPDILKINLKNQKLKEAVMERYNIKNFPKLLYYKKIINIEDFKNFYNDKEFLRKKDEYLRNEIGKIIKSGNIVLFMKGDISNPYCQFSRKVVNILENNGVDLKKVIYYDILMNKEMREKIKEVNEWPTFPQLFVNGEFIGGCDILKNMKDGELKKILNL